MFNNERTFGVEIEFIGDADSVKEAVRTLGIDCHVERYNHNTRPHWKITTDASVQANRHQTGRGLEIVSPILKGQGGLEQLKKVCKALNTAGAKVNKTCGLHIHHDAADFNTDTFKNLIKIYKRFEITIDTLVPKSRRGSNNNYCGSLVNINEEAIERQNGIEGIRQVFHHRRYNKLNLESYVTHGTVEFRQHGGTIEFPKIENWVKLTQAMVERVAGRKVKQGTTIDWNGFKYCLRTFLDKETIKYFNKRRRELAA